MTKGKEWRCILMFMIPIMLGNFLQQLYNTADSMIVGNFAKAQFSLAAVGTCSPATMLYVSLAMGFCQGGGVVISQFFGARLEREMKRAISTLLIFSAAFGLVMTLFGVFCSKWLLRVILSVDAAILPLANTYMVLYSIGLVFSFTYNGVAAILQALGNSRSSLLFLTVSALSNIVLDLLFVVTFDWGVAGAAIATTIAQFLCAAASVIYLVRKYGDFLPKGREFAFDPGHCKTIVKMGLPNALTMAAVNISSLLLQRMVNGFGPTNMEGFLAANRLDSLTTVPTTSFNAALLTFTGQNIGAGDEKRAKRGLYVTVAMTAAAAVVIIVIVYTFAPALIGMFGVSEAALALGVRQTRYVIPTMIIFAVYMPCGNFIRGAGDAPVATCGTLIAMVVRVTCAYLFLGTFGEASPWIFLPVGWCCGLILNWSYFFSGKWRGKAVARRKSPAPAVEEGKEE